MKHIAIIDGTEYKEKLRIFREFLCGIVEW